MIEKYRSKEDDYDFIYDEIVGPITGYCLTHGLVFSGVLLFVISGIYFGVDSLKILVSYPPESESVWWGISCVVGGVCHLAFAWKLLEMKNYIDSVDEEE